MGLVQGDKYIAFSFVEIGRNDDDYQDLDEAFNKGVKNQLDALRAAVDKSLDDLAEALGECEERKTIDHCTDCIEGQRRDFNLPHDIALAQAQEDKH